MNDNNGRKLSFVHIHLDIKLNYIVHMLSVSMIFFFILLLFLMLLFAVAFHCGPSNENSDIFLHFNLLFS